MKIASYPSNIKDMAEDICRLMSAAAEQKGLALLLDFDPACPPIVTIDVNRLRQILENLLGNAIKFTESGYVILAFKAREKPGHDVN